MFFVVVNIFDNDWDLEQSQQGFKWKRMRLGHRLGGRLLGASVYELPPDQRSFPYHAHHANEEMLIVLEGVIMLRTRDGERELERGDATLFSCGQEGAHQVINRSDKPARFVLLSTMVEPDIVEYLDTGKIGVFAGQPLGGVGESTLYAFLRGNARVGYFDNEPTIENFP